MNTSAIKLNSFYAQGQRHAARGLLTLWLLAIGSLEGAFAAPGSPPARTSAIAHAQEPELHQNLAELQAQEASHAQELARLAEQKSATERANAQLQEELQELKTSHAQELAWLAEEKLATERANAQLQKKNRELKVRYAQEIARLVAEKALFQQEFTKSAAEVAGLAIDKTQGVPSPATPSFGVPSPATPSFGVPSPAMSGGVASSAIDKAVWERYLGHLGVAPPLPEGIEQILNAPCPFWAGRKVRDTHLLALIPAQVTGSPLTLDYLGQLIERPYGGGHATKYGYYWDGARKAIGQQASGGPYWVWMTRDVLPGSCNKSYPDQCALVAEHAKRTGLGYEVPGALEAAVVMLLHHVRSGERLYSDNPWMYTLCQESIRGYQLAVGGFSSGGLNGLSFYYSGAGSDSYGVAGLRKFGAPPLSAHPVIDKTQGVAIPALPSFGLPVSPMPGGVADPVIDAEVWERYFGDVGDVPPLPGDIEQILNAPCPFWAGRKVRDTHLLALIPAQVTGSPLTLDYLGQLIERPYGGGHATKYGYYWDGARKAIGQQASGGPYWVWMTRDVLPGSCNKSYPDQCALVAEHAKRTGLGYEVPGALEAAVVMLLHHVRSGERLYDDVWTRCRKNVQNYLARRAPG